MDQGDPPASPRRYWFKRDRYGWGWIPVRWQGCAFVVLFAVILLAVPLLARALFDLSTDATVGIVIVLGIALSMMTERVAPRRRWRWGKSPGDNPEGDF